jgi:hypothetical protein
MVGETSHYGFANTRIPLKYQDFRGGLPEFQSSNCPTQKPAPSDRRYPKTCLLVRVSRLGGGGFLNILDVILIPVAPSVIVDCLLLTDG